MTIKLSVFFITIILLRLCSVMCLETVQRVQQYLAWVCVHCVHRNMAYVPAGRLQLDRRPNLFVVSREQLQPLTQRITVSVSGNWTNATLFSCWYVKLNVQKMTLVLVHDKQCTRGGMHNNVVA